MTTHPGTATVTAPAAASHAPPQRARRVVWVVPVLLTLGILGAAGAGWLRPWFRSDGSVIDMFVVAPTTMMITLKEDGELRPVQSIEIKNEVQGERVTIEWLVPESTRVSAGDLLVKLASDDIRDRLEMDELELSNGKTALEQAEKELELTLSENESRIQKAEIDLKIAELEYTRYTEGEYEKALKAININIQQTETDLARKEDELVKNQRLEAMGFVSRAKIQEIEDTIERLKMTLSRYQLEKAIHENYEWEKNKLERSSAVDQARDELERERARAQSRESQARAKVQEQSQGLAIRETRYNRRREQLDRCEIRAPVDGVVQYGESGRGRGWRSERVGVGEQVFPGQIIMTLPDTSQMMVSTRIHEADRHKVGEGLRCIVTVPAVPGRTFTGTVTKIARFADSERSWLNPNLKEHATEIRLDEHDPALSPGDTARIEILIEEVRDVLAVPVQAIFSRGRQHYAFVQRGNDSEVVSVGLGRATPTMVEITGGLQAGQRVLMAPTELQLAKLPAPGESTGEGFNATETAAADTDGTSAG